MTGSNGSIVGIGS